MSGEAVVTMVVECTAPCGVEVQKVALRLVVRPASTQMPYADRESVGEPEHEGSGYHPRSGRRGGIPWRSVPLAFRRDHSIQCF